MRMLKGIAGSTFLAALGFGSLCAQAARLGHPGVSTTATKGAPTQWQLLADPDDATSGSITTSYTAFQYGYPVASLAEVDPLNGYEVTSIDVQVATMNLVTSFVQFTPATPGADVYVAPPLTGVHETGIVQVFWQLIPGSNPDVNTGDVNIYQLIFNNLTGNPNAMATFHDYLDPGAANGGATPTPDAYSGMVNGVPFTYSADPTNTTYYVPPSQISTDTITVQVDPLPAPSVIASCGVLGTMGLLPAMLIRRRNNAILLTV